MIGLMGVWVVAALAGDAAHVEATRLCAADYKHWQEEVNQAVGELPVLAHLLACDSMGVANRALELLIRSKNLKEIRGQLRMLTKNADEGTRLRAAQVLMYMPLHDDLMPMLLEAAARKNEAAIDALTHPASPDLLDTYKQLAQSAGRASQRSGLVALRQLDPCLALVYFLGTPDVADADKYPLFCDFLKAIDLCSDAAMIDLALESLEQNPISDLTFFTFTRGMNQARTEKSGACSPSFEMPPEYVPQPDAPSTWICAQPTPKPDRVVASCMAPPHSGWDCEEPMYSACSAFFETDFEALAQRLHQRLVDRVNATQQTNLRRILHIVDEIPWRCSDMLHNRLGYGQMLCDH